MTTHNIKIWPQWFEQVRIGAMTFQIRKDDRNYQVGDELVLEEFRPGVGEYTGRKLSRKVLALWRDKDAADLNVADGYCLMAIT